ncbi:MAG: FkbM family methyltransferase [Burkholderiales bacterium]
MTAVSRNAPCPCGSGRRYKECHGAFGAPGAVPAAVPAAPPAPALRPSPLDRLAEAKRAIDRDDPQAARAICDDVLRELPGHPYAIALLAHIEADAGAAAPALRRLLGAVRDLGRFNLPPAVAYGVWSALNATFTLALSRHDAASRDVRERYAAWQDARANAVESAPGRARDVAVVLVLDASTSSEAAAATLQSLVAQTARPAQIVVTTIGVSPAAALVRARLDLLTIEATFLPGHATNAAEAWNRGVQACTAHWVAIVEPPASYEPAHIATLVDRAARSGARFAWSAGTFVRTPDLAESVLAAEAKRMDAASTAAVMADSLGLAFVGQWSPLPGTGALMFERALHAELGGFRPLRGHEAWDFCLRAAWDGEPVRSPTPTYRHAIARADDLPQAERESIQLAMFREFHARASRADAAAANPFAPCYAVWGTRYLRRLFDVGHVLMVDEAALERFVDRVDAMAREAQAELTPGINFLGFAFGEFGLGESMRSLARACEAGGVPFVVKDVGQHLATRQADTSLASHLSDDLRHTVSLMCVNPDMLAKVRPLLARTRERGGIPIGYWYWELETTPRMWEPAYDAVDEVWCATQFVADAVMRATDKPVIKIPPPLEIAAPTGFARPDFGLPDRRFLFLFTFDYNSFVKRKNPEAVIDAFRAAFPPSRDDVGLVIKSVNGSNHPERVAAMMARAGGDPRIVAIDRFLSREASYGLILATDAYVSLHRSEGLGLGLCEAMALGRPTIATAYSGNLEFMNASNSLLVDYRLVPVQPGEYLVDDERFVWADPDIESAARAMRTLAGDDALRARITGAGQREIATRFTRTRTAALIRERLEALGVTAGGATRRPAPSTASAADEVFVSYAQNGEDVVLAYVLADVHGGRYVDVGAHDPDVHSVTRAFYDRGWSGVNVEASAEWHGRLRAARKRDVNLEVAAGRRDGVATLHAFAGTGLSTLDRDVARGHVAAGLAQVAREVPMRTLAGIFDQHAKGEVHFLKIDVEGAEADVLAGADFARHRPWIVVVESTRPLTGIASHGEWEHLLLPHGYRFAFDDGLNRYYVSDEHAGLCERFGQAPLWRVLRAPDVAASAPHLDPEQRLSPAECAFLDADRAAPPTLDRPASQLCTRSQYDETSYRAACRLLRETPTMRRRQWEYAYIVRCLEAAGMLRPGKRGLGFACAGDPLVAALAAQGCEIVATDRDLDRVAGDRLNGRGACAADAFRARVASRAVDPRAIPAELRGFDFVWSCGATDRLQSCASAIEFLAQSLSCLAPGGLAVHTVTLNLSSNDETLESNDLTVLRKRDVERFAQEAARDGRTMWPLNLHPGDAPADRFVDTPPYRTEPHLRVRHGRFAVTSLGLAVAIAPAR